MGFASVSGIINQIMSALGVCERIFEIMDEPIQIQSGSIRDELKSSPIIVEFRNASFAYPTKPSVVVLKHVNLKIRKGESVALVGASGSGKSSIVSLILRFYDLVEGELYIGGRNIKTLDLNYLRRQMGFVAQEPVLFSGSLRENIEYGLEEHGNDEKVMRALEIANAKEFVLNEDKFPEKLDTLVGERGIQLSGGQKQRIAIGNCHLIQLEV